MSTSTLSSDAAAFRLVRAVQDLSLARDVERIREIVRTAARDIAGADGATFVLRDGDRCYYVDEDAIGPLWRGQRFPMTACISGWAMLNRQAARVPDIFVDDRIPIDAYRVTFVKSLVMVPIRADDPIGAIGTYWAEPHTASDAVVELLQALANTTAVAMENVRVYQELEQRVAARTKELEAANEELDAFSHSVSHDLRAPLRHLAGFSDLLRADPALGEQSRHYAERIGAAALRMSSLIESLLSFARLGRAALTRRPVDLAAVAGDAQREVVADAGDRAIEWRMAAEGVVSADADLLRQVFVNLLSNAVKYTRGRSPAVIEVAVRDDVEPGALAVCVRDNGAGFDPKYAGRLFGTFQRLHTEREFEGTGIGLANVRRIVHRHGGRTWADGVPDGGATFWFTLPV
ncbi:MAG TPA: ATP-binding protein [Vicinamibacterales bacterium]|nr:ATP-binding protein [Vicinamibacterales bacterium]